MAQNVNAASESFREIAEESSSVSESRRSPAVSGIFDKPLPPSSPPRAEADSLAPPSSDEPALDALQSYLHSAGRVALLSAEEELNLARQMEDGRALVIQGVLECPSVQASARTLLNKFGNDPRGAQQMVRALGGDDSADQEARVRDVLVRMSELDATSPRVPFGLVDDVLETLSADTIEWLATQALDSLRAQNLPDAYREHAADLNALVRRGMRISQEAARQLTIANLRLVASIAKRYARGDLELLDLMQEGNIGLMRAVDRYDYRRGYRFSTYAVHWIRQAVSRAVANQGRTIRLPVHLTQLAQTLRRKQRKLTQEFGREATLEEVAKSEGKPLAVCRAALSDPHLSRLDAPAHPDSDQSLVEGVADDTLPSPDEVCCSFSLRECVFDALKTLPPREASVLSMRFGLGEYSEEMTLEEIGRELNVTRERARQIEAKALSRLRRSPNTRELRTFRSELV